jgi:hypothetical protein
LLSTKASTSKSFGPESSDLSAETGNPGMKEEHLDMNESVSYNSTPNNFSGSYNYNLKRDVHVKLIHPGNCFICEYCDKSFSTNAPHSNIHFWEYKIFRSDPDTVIL